ncbi:MAG: sigma-70 family RNA polymerase sigma factor, partial [bacterium]|nr:sigma-70 family RNA polymerase sigma factor [bacterium]
YKKIIKKIQGDDAKLLSDIPTDKTIESYLDTLIKDFLVEESYIFLLEQGWIYKKIGHGLGLDVVGEVDKRFEVFQDELEMNDFGRLKEFSEMSTFTTYLTAILSRLFLDYWRGWSFSKSTPDLENFFIANAPPYAEIYKNIEEEDVKRKVADSLPGWLEKLSANERLAVQLNFEHNFSLSEIAMSLDTTRYSAEKLLNEAIAKLSKEIQSMLEHERQGGGSQ